MVDPAVWAWRGRRFAHLVSDSSHDELHAMAERLDLPRVAFQGDHYDVDAGLRDRALGLGAQAVPARELVGRLRASGLRRPPGGRIPWERVEIGPVPDGRVAEAVTATPAAAPLAEAAGASSRGMAGGGPVDLRVFLRPDEAVVMLEGPCRPGRPDGVPSHLTVAHPGWRLELILP